MNEEYFEWLLNLIDVNKEDQNGYGMLCSIMHDAIFHPILEMDENRWEDGVQYRFDFASWHEKGDSKKASMVADHLDDSLGGCTVLELLISLAEKISWEMEEGPYEARPAKWFEEMISNLGLDIYTNGELMGNEAAYFEVDAILENFVFRRYHYNGEGGLFPLQNPQEDQREVEIAIQKNDYLMENYDILR